MQVPVEQLIADLPAEAWQRLSCGVGSKGPREFDWTWVEMVSGQQTGWSRWLLARRKLSDPTQLAYFMVFAPNDTSMSEVVRVAGARWSIEMGFEVTLGSARVRPLRGAISRERGIATSHWYYWLMLCYP